MTKRSEKCKVEIAKDYLQEMTRATAAGLLSRVPPGFLRNLILEKKTETTFLMLITFWKSELKEIDT
jgi:heme-degrading monooxygenase HmoA